MASVTPFSDRTYRVCWYERETNEQKQKYFFGKAAFAQASQFKDIVEKDNPDKRTEPHVNLKISNRNTSGKVGVMYLPPAIYPSGKKESAKYIANINIRRNGLQKQSKVSFSINKYGEEEAFYLACAVRTIYEKNIDKPYTEIWDEIDEYLYGVAR
jgi:hypothetical protein